MSRLTHERANGIKTGFWSPAKKEVLVQRLGVIEQSHDSLIALVCDHYCNRPDIAGCQDELDGMCANCPLTKLDDLIEGGNVMDNEALVVARGKEQNKILSDHAAGMKTNSQWVSSEDRLPEMGETVLAVDIHTGEVLPARMNVFGYRRASRRR